MPKGVPLTIAQIEMIREAGADPARSNAEVARVTGLDRSSVCRVRGEDGVMIARIALLRVNRAASVRALAQEGCSNGAIADRLGLHRQTVSRILCKERPARPAAGGDSNADYQARIEETARLMAEGLDDAAIAERLGCVVESAARYRRAAALLPPIAPPPDWRALPRRKLPADHPAFWPVRPPAPGHFYPDIVMPPAVARRDAVPFHAGRHRPEVFSGAGSPAAACAGM
jgi:DNA-binding CsgD family transcriptional regulator